MPVSTTATTTPLQSVMAFQAASAPMSAPGMPGFDPGNASSQRSGVPGGLVNCVVTRWPVFSRPQT